MANSNVAAMVYQSEINLVRTDSIKISVIGLGYVGLPVAVAFSKAKFPVVGYDLKKDRIKKLLRNEDETGEVSRQDLEKTNIQFSNNFKDIKIANFHIITVPTPIDEFKNPDLSFIENAAKTIGKILKKNDIIVVESTVYPGVTEDIVVPILEKQSNLKFNIDFSVGYSPERINPADKKINLRI